ncbi:hypothetical protein OEZ85_009068 [Tetradesmus obliquus]|uniref:SAP domain-containing protein n=1 Tax=Tetradesmus obliquus TaxID=3088 RepID=A0ABY8TKP4_TETOB|nr:hypothetical protein OEZ85_009068 [Tetradesmus obliquus]
MAQEIVNLNVIKAKVQTFKLEQLKEVLQQLSMSRSGKKEELSNRILDLFKDAAHLNSSGHRVVDQDRLTNAALVVDAVYRRLRDAELKHLAQTHRSVALHRHVDEVEARYRAAAGGANKRARITAPAAAPAAARPPVAGGELGIEEVIGRFLDGSEGLGLLNTQVRCLCAAATRIEPLLQCCGACCGVWQHVECVKQQLTLKPGLPPLRDAVTHTPLVQRAAFFCERCRVSRADPFWELFDPTVMLPVLGRPNGRSMTVGPVPDVPCSGTGMREALLSRHQVTLLKAKEAEYKLQAFCLQLDDPVPFRFHWPMAANLTWSGSGTLLQQTVPACRRGHVKLGTNQRDEPYDLAAAVRGFPTSHGPCTVSIELRYAEPEPHYIFMVAIMRRRTREQVKALMKQPESLEAAVERVRRHMRGGSSSSSGAAASSSTAAAAAANGHAGAAGVIDDDDDVVMGNTVVSLKDPYSNQRMVTAARFVDTAGAAPSAFDLDSFLEVAQATRKWMDPHSSKPSCVQSLQVDAYLTHILRVLAGLPEVTEVEITPEAHWRPAGSTAAFMCVLEQARDMRAAAAAAAAAAACAAAATGAAAGDSDEEDDEELFRREIAQMQDRKPQLLPQKGGAVEVIEILDSDDEQPAQQQQQQQQQQPAAAAAAGQQQ